MRAFIKTASSPTLLEDASQLKALFSTEGWQTLITFARESGKPLSHPLSINSQDTAHSHNFSLLFFIFIFYF
jgi:hypothetical protein